MQNNLCIKLTTRKGMVFKTRRYAEPWDMTKSVSVHSKYLEDFKARLDNRRIKTSEEEMMDAAVTAMWDSKFFTQEQMTAWEKLDDANKTMMNVKTYFIGAYQDLDQYSRATASKWT